MFFPPSKQCCAMLCYTYQYHCMKEWVSQNLAASTLLGKKGSCSDINGWNKIIVKCKYHNKKRKKFELLYIHYFHFAWDCMSLSNCNDLIATTAILKDKMLNEIFRKLIQIFYPAKLNILQIKTVIFGNILLHAYWNEYLIRPFLIICLPMVICCIWWKKWYL